MAAITFTQIQARRDALMRVDSRVTVIIANPNATDDATVGVYWVKDVDPGDNPVTTVSLPGNAKNAWKAFSYANLGLAYGLP